MAILEAGRKLPFSVQPAAMELPELQGEPEEIAAEKCRLAADKLQAAGGWVRCGLFGFDLLRLLP